MDPIEQQIVPKCEFHASPHMKQKVMEAAAASAMRRQKRRRYWRIAAVAASIVVVATLGWGIYNTNKVPVGNTTIIATAEQSLPVVQPISHPQEQVAVNTGQTEPSHAATHTTTKPKPYKPQPQTPQPEADNAEVDADNAKMEAERAEMEAIMAEMESERERMIQEMHMQTMNYENMTQDIETRGQQLADLVEQALAHE